MILKKIKPYLTSQIRSRVSTVEELVKLGHQIKKDHEQQLQYERCMSRKSSQEVTQKPISNKTTVQPQVQCWRCKGDRSPGCCPLYANANPSSKQQHAFTSQRSFHSHKSGSQAMNNSVTATTNKILSTSKKPPSTPKPVTPGVIPQQLVVPVRIGGWSGKAIVDTGASYTMIHESLWQKLSPQESFQPWSLGPLYLANGETEVPLGWLQLQIHIHNKTFTLPVAVLSPKALAYAVVLGLDFIFFSGLQINVIDKKYSFKSTPQEDHSFQPGNASVPDISPQRQKTGQHAKIFNQSLSLLSSIPLPQPVCRSSLLVSTDTQTLIDRAVSEAHLPPAEKNTLRRILESNPQVCSLQPGCTDVLQHTIYTQHQVPIKQRPYRMSSRK